MEDETRINRDIAEFQALFCPYGWRDIKFMMEAAHAVGMAPGQVYELVKDFQSDVVADWDDIDPCYVMLEHILQNARGTIERSLALDIQNDLPGGGFWTVGNYMCSTYDWTGEGYAALEGRLSETSAEEKRSLEDCLSTQYFLDSVGLSMSEN